MTRMLVIGDSAKPRSRNAYLLLRLVTLRTSTSRSTGVKLAVVAFLVEEVGGDDRLGDLADGDVAHGDVLDHAAARGVVLEAQRAVEPRAVHAALLGEDVARAAGDLAADGHAAVAVLHLAVADDDVLDRRVQRAGRRRCGPT